MAEKKEAATPKTKKPLTRGRSIRRVLNLERSKEWIRNDTARHILMGKLLAKSVIDVKKIFDLADAFAAEEVARSPNAYKE